MNNKEINGIQKYTNNNITDVQEQVNNEKNEDFGLFNSYSNEQIPLYFIKIEGDVFDQFAKIKLTHKYFNSTNHVIDTVFKFPKGLYQIFDSLTVKIDDKTINGLIVSREEVEWTYDRLNNEGNTIVKTEYYKKSDEIQNPDIVITKVGNIPPFKGIDLDFTFIQKLDISCGKKYCLRLPLTLIPRYNPSPQVSTKLMNKNQDLLNLSYIKEVLNINILWKLKFIRLIKY